MDGEGDDYGGPAESLAILGSRPIVKQHISKRSLRNKALSIGFNDKALIDYVGGFHKRKKKRRKEAQQQIQEKERRKRIAARKKRKLEKEFVMNGGVHPENDSDSGLEDSCTDVEEDEVSKNPSALGTKTYDTGDMTITVTTSDLSGKDNDLKHTRSSHCPTNFESQKNPCLEVKTKPFKKTVKIAAKKRSYHKRHKKEKGSQRGGNKKKNKK
ncbi:hypothetical protein ZOSMA_125G00360 [Zostera marina]|uniref:Ribosomal RNA-processing protein 17 n=1 Tax=Zostera marina TaxID=29655 RepID=A0A0K9PZS9_ZOSMR|nr:hypothetical protein ZOSMA_125G00360 [Zostera marina]